jgi:hypothetical protein
MYGLKNARTVNIWRVHGSEGHEVLHMDLCHGKALPALL